MDQISILMPILILIIWNFLIFLFLATSRFFLFRKKDPQIAAHTKDLRGLLPLWTERLADNYNHLFEQPVAFYAAVISIAIINNFDLFLVQLAWTFVILRVVHSIVQITFNFVPLRFFLFCLGWFVIVYMIYHQVNLLS
tara:strand:+ start:284 stop:700 length:417 start_codon:yes stop_codon:yes gene_type:complete